MCKPHLHVAVQVCVAEGAGQKLVADANHALDASGNACARTQTPSIASRYNLRQPLKWTPLPQYAAGMLQRAARRSVRCELCAQPPKQSSAAPAMMTCVHCCCLPQRACFAVCKSKLQ